jgi:hypothetical protein
MLQLGKALDMFALTVRLGSVHDESLSLEVRTVVCRDWHYRPAQSGVNSIPPGRKYLMNSSRAESHGGRLPHVLDRTCLSGCDDHRSALARKTGLGRYRAYDARFCSS